MKQIILFVCLFAVLNMSCESGENNSFTNTLYLLAYIYPDQPTYAPYQFRLGYVKKNAKKAYNAGSYKFCKNGEIMIFWNNDSTKLTPFYNDDYLDYRDIDFKIKPKPGDYMAIKAVADNKILYWEGFLPVDYPVSTNLPDHGDTIDIPIIESNIDFMGIKGYKKDRGNLFVALHLTGTKKLKSFSYSINHQLAYPYYRYYTFSDSITLPVYVDTNAVFINIGIGYFHIDSSLAAAYLLDFFPEQEVTVFIDAQCQNFVKSQKLRTLKERSNIQGDGVGLIFYETHDGRHLIGRIIR